MWAILSAITRAFDYFLAPFDRLNPWVGLGVVSVLTGVVMLVIFGKTSNQAKIAETKGKLKAYIMEMWIFRNDVRIMFSSIANVIRNNVHYLRHSLRPLVFILVPVVIIMVQLGIRYGNLPLMPGDVAVVRVCLDDGVKPTEAGIELVAGRGIKPVSPALRIDSAGEVYWKIRAGLPGKYTLSFRVGDEELTKSVVVGPARRIEKLAAVRGAAGTWSAFLYPSEPPIPRDSVIRSISISYPERKLSFFGLGVNWLIAFFIISIAAGFALKGVLGVEV